MIKNKFGEIVLDENDLCSIIMQGRNLLTMKNVTVDRAIDIEDIIKFVEEPGTLLTWGFPANEEKSVPEFDALNQSRWLMPDSYKNLDIAEYVLSLCTTQEQLQRVGHELFLFQEKNLFDLLRYLKFFVDTLKSNNVIWGVGRGSSVASYVLYLLEVHKIDSMFYDLDPHEFLR
jgi:DNA polymerase III alpha subunit